MAEILLRPAARADAAAIRRLIYTEKLNPISLDWRRFLVAVNESGAVVGCIQVKPHGDGTRELASLVVQPAYRGQKLASRLIEKVLSGETGPLYLTCRGSLEPFYRRFGFSLVPTDDLPPYFARLARFVALVRRVARLPEGMAIMRRA